MDINEKLCHIHREHFRDIVLTTCRDPNEGSSDKNQEQMKTRRDKVHEEAKWTSRHVTSESKTRNTKNPPKQLINQESKIIKMTEDTKTEVQRTKTQTYRHVRIAVGENQGERCRAVQLLLSSFYLTGWGVTKL